LNAVCRSAVQEEAGVDAVQPDEDATPTVAMPMINGSIAFASTSVA
jgi:hypothetical protein